jgi:hypothetical protein
VAAAGNPLLAKTGRLYRQTMREVPLHSMNPVICYKFRKVEKEQRFMDFDFEDLENVMK